MFELPEAKRVRREDLLDSASDGSDVDEDDQHHAALRARLEAQLASAFTFAPIDTPSSARAPAPAADQDSDGEAHRGQEKQQRQQEEEEEEEFEFRLFSSAKPAAKVILPDDDEGAPRGEGAMLRRRPLRYYLAEPLTDAQRAEVEFAAVSAEDVFERAARRCWGMEMPWRVTHIDGAAGAGTKKKAASSATGLREDGKRKRPGQKKRLAMRTREREAKKKAEEAEKLKTSKEEQLREKKKRLNRQRKLKRRAKAKEERAAAGLPSDHGGSSSEGDD
ncbi:hypothetical protein VD0002_g7816 [Verticillium dahliae]|uniref:Uncharacterized protein n=2 Tax=Verticillium dahliae TaxID=27337 RepID=G2WUI6_VERDV|nr:uncharacterized protein VDAG_01459 [Verticillium dahliae VdLs.17]KAF3348219.1 hypothetical protein VdG2_03101 [Verticillium dahliae VDG2]KAG7117529.1 hypothetical protein HYQ44_006154 [Verticillium longisporum]KAH6698594.1 hypothetical protein EV126DRAFT_48478 [Verticillium dahliae]EGY17777.1 hypothetical protein VDAG_01459 [Verticillium dahliae VdLs.17]PNH35574.1 hypothetical protein BJF96_g1464 [Verticillium dahliae]